MKDFERTLYEALLLAFGKTLAKCTASSRGFILKAAGKDIIEYLNENGLEFVERGDQSDLGRLARLFALNGFAETLDMSPLPKGHNFIWHTLYGVNAYRRFDEDCDQPLPACPLNLCLSHLADKQGKTMIHRGNRFHADGDIVESHYEVVDGASATADRGNAIETCNAIDIERGENRGGKPEHPQAERRNMGGILPICSTCKKIRDDEGVWHAVEVYMRTHMDSDFSHGFCPDCESDVMKEIDERFGPATQV